MKGDALCIFGSRDFPDLSLVEAAVIRLALSTTIIVGGARGVDKEAENVARRRGMKVEVYNADWDRGRLAGFERNAIMVNRATRGLGFWDGQSHGTLDTLNRFHRAHKPIEAVIWPVSYEEWAEQAGTDGKLKPRPWLD